MSLANLLWFQIAVAILFVNDGRHHISRKHQIIILDGFPVGDTAGNQYGVQAEGVGTMNVGCQLVADHYHITGSAASQCLPEDGGMGCAQSFKM